MLFGKENFNQRIYKLCFCRYMPHTKLMFRALRPQRYIQNPVKDLRWSCL